MLAAEAAGNQDFAALSVPIGNDKWVGEMLNKFGVSDPFSGSGASPSSPPPPPHEPLIPRNWRQAIPYLVWFVLILAFGFVFAESIGELVTDPKWRAVLAFFVVVGLTAMLIHWRQIRESMPLAYASGVLILVIALSPYVEQARLPFSRSTENSDDLNAANKVLTNANLPPANSALVIAQTLTPAYLELGKAQQANTDKDIQINALKSQLNTAQQQLSATRGAATPEPWSKGISPALAINIAAELQGLIAGPDMPKTFVVVTSTTENEPLRRDLAGVFSAGYGASGAKSVFHPMDLPDYGRDLDAPKLPTTQSPPGIIIHSHSNAANFLDGVLRSCFVVRRTDRPQEAANLVSYYQQTYPNVSDIADVIWIEIASGQPWQRNCN